VNVEERDPRAGIQRAGRKEAQKPRARASRTFGDMNGRELARRDGSVYLAHRLANAPGSINSSANLAQDQNFSNASA